MSVLSSSASISVTRESIVKELAIARRKFKMAKTEDAQASYGMYESVMLDRLHNFDLDNK